MTDRHDPYLTPTAYIDADHPNVAAYARETAAGANSPREKAVAVYYAVRDDIRYEPYRISLDPSEMTASATLARGDGFCVAKAVLLAAAGRAVGVPTRLGFCDVRNHLATEKLLDALGTDLFAWHGYVEMLIDDRWVKATPAFNLSLCERFGVLPLEFDGRSDSIFHPYDREGRLHMEYVRDHGTFADLPLELLRDELRTMYPDWTRNLTGSFADDAATEHAGDRAL